MLVTVFVGVLEFVESDEEGKVGDKFSLQKSPSVQHSYILVFEL